MDLSFNHLRSKALRFALTALAYVLVRNVEFIVMPSKLGETNLGADCRGFYSAFYRSDARNVNRASWV
jgi:hypothetical protein